MTHILSIFTFSLPLSLFSKISSQIEIDTFESVNPVESIAVQPLPSIESLFIKTLFLLIFMISFVICSLWLLKKIQHGISQKRGESIEKRIMVIEKAYLSSKTSIWYVTIDDVPCVIVEGQQGSSICQLHKYSAQEKTIST